MSGLFDKNKEDMDKYEKITVAVALMLLVIAAVLCVLILLVFGVGLVELLMWMVNP